MGLFDINDEKLQAFYHRALVEANYGFVNPIQNFTLKVEQSFLYA